MENVVTQASRLCDSDINIHQLQSHAATKLSQVRRTRHPAGQKWRGRPGKPAPTMLQCHWTLSLYPNTYATGYLRKMTLSHDISVLGCDNYHVTMIKLACWIHKILKMCSELRNLADNGCWQYGMVSLLCNHQPVQMSMSAEIAEFYPCSACFCTVLYNQI
jgi:hypothetical protein